MRPSNNEIAEIIDFVFIDAFKKRHIKKFAHNNSLRSSYFLSSLAKAIHLKFFPESKLNVQLVSENETDSEREGGEWLYDFCITSQMQIHDEKELGKAAINTNVLFACESEFDTSLKSFAVDFAKLICSNASQYCYIQGLNQITNAGRENFIDGRLYIIREQLKDLIKDDFVIAFVPTPGRLSNKEVESFWDITGVEKWIQIFAYNKSANSFSRYT